MRYATITHNGRSVAAHHTDRGWQTAAPEDASLLGVVSGAEPDFTGPLVPDADAQFALPYRPPTLYGIGLNYRDTVIDMGWDTPAQPYLFPKLSSSATGPFDPIVVDTDLTTRVDWEAEIGVVIGQHTRSVPQEKAMDVVFGYTIANDVSARDLQAADGQWVRGKGLDTFCPLGPYVVTKDEIADPHDLAIRTRVNGTLMQDGRSSSMIFRIPELISYCSSFFTLYPGDVILTGTPSGCGDFRDPRIALTPGDYIEIDIDHLGRQHNRIVAPAGVSARP